MVLSIYMSREMVVASGNDNLLRLIKSLVKRRDETFSLACSELRIEHIEPNEKRSNCCTYKHKPSQAFFSLGIAAVKLNGEGG